MNYMVHPIEFDYLITADGETHNLNNLGGGIAVMDIGGFGMPDIDYLTERGPFQDGATVLDYFLRPRVIQYMFRAQGCSRQQYWDLRSKLINWLRPNRHSVTQLRPATLRKVLPDGSKRDIDVFVERGPVFDMSGNRDRWDEHGFTEVVRFIAHNPVLYDPDLGSYSVVLPASTELVFPITFPIEFAIGIVDETFTLSYSGTWQEYPVIVIEGPISGLTIENVSTGEEIVLEYSIAVGQTVTIDLGYGRKTVKDQAGNNLIGIVSDDSDVATFHLAPDPEVAGGNNSIHVSGAGALSGRTSITISYYNRYIGM